MLPALSEPVALPPGRSVRIARVHQPAGEPVPERFLHFHGPAELVFMEQGSGCFISEAGEWTFAPGSVLYAPGMAIHDFAFAPGERGWTLVQFDPLAIDPRIAALPPCACAAAPGALAAARAALLLDWLAASLDDHQAEAQVVVLLEALLLALRGAFGDDGSVNAAPSSGLAHFRPLLQQWERLPDKALSLAEAASLCRLSSSYFSRLFAKTFGAGFVTYQTRFRLQQAARMLATGDLPVSQIGYRTGFHSHAYFAQCYRAAFGVSPSAHRKMLLAGKTADA
ncbi:MAG: AraC family transcriptional regulator [Novosphingobium sp.]|nr:AraC family transcriptional regulator [Novosphingobium sp.]